MNYNSYSYPFIPIFGLSTLKEIHTSPHGSDPTKDFDSSGHSYDHVNAALYQTSPIIAVSMSGLLRFQLTFPIPGSRDENGNQQISKLDLGVKQLELILWNPNQESLN